MRYNPNSKQEQMVQYVEERIDGRIDRYWQALKPVWRSAERASQTLVWLSAGALVGSLTLTQVFLTQLRAYDFVVLLPVSWVLLVLTLILSLVRLGTFTKLRSAPARYETQKKELRDHVRSVHGRDDEVERLNEKATEIIENAMDVPRKTVKIHDWLTWGSAVTFIAGISVLAVFAILNLPSI